MAEHARPKPRLAPTHLERAAAAQASTEGERDAPERVPLDELVARERRGRRRRRLAWFLVAVLATGGIGVGIWSMWPRPPAAAELYRTLPVERGPLVSEVSASGRLEASGTVEVGARISGTIGAVLVDYNDQVRKGDVLAHFETELLDAQLEQSRASIAAARATLRQAKIERRQAKAELDRSERLTEKGIEPAASHELAHATVDQADARMASSRAQIELQQAALKLAETNLRHAIVTAPIDGVVLSREVDEGQTVAASLQAPTLFVLAEDLTHMRVIAQVDETDIARVAEGQSATFTVDAHPRRTFEASVTQVRNAPQLSSNVVTYEVVLEVDNADLALKPGMTTSVRIEVARVPEALKVPNGALRFTPPGEEPIAGDGVWVIEGQTLHHVPLRVGISDGEHTEVLEILEERLEPGAQLLVDLSPVGREELSP